MLEQLIFEYGKSEGFTDMEIYYENNNKFSCKIFKGEINNYSISQEGGISFRGIYNGQMGYAYTEKIDQGSIKTLVKEAKENAKIIESEEDEIIFEGSKQYSKVSLYSNKLANVSIDEKLNFLIELEKEAYSIDKRVINVNYCMYDDYENEVKLHNTKGISKSEKSNIAFCYISVIVKEDGEVQSGSAFKICKNFEKFDAKHLAKEAVNRAISYLGAKPVKSKNYTILLENIAAANLLQTFANIFSADNVQKGRSLLKDKIGETIANPLLTIIDNPLMPNGAASYSFDSEGVPSQKISLVEEGVLKNLLYNLKTAKKDRVKSTGHGHKSSYKGTITVSPSNLYIKPHLNKYEHMLSSIKEGIIISELQGLHSGANPISGDFSLAAKGYYVKDGSIVKPVNQITIASNFYELLKNIEMIGDDLKFAIPGTSSIGSPTLKIKNISVSGE